jgi:hypothetical protein
MELYKACITDNKINTNISKVYISLLHVHTLTGPFRCRLEMHKMHNKIVWNELIVSPLVLKSSVFYRSKTHLKSTMSNAIKLLCTVLLH